MLTLATMTLLAALLVPSPSDSTKVWIYFDSKSSSECTMSVESCHLAALDHDKVRVVEQSGARILNESRWLNALSVKAASTDLGDLERLPFVDRIVPVGRLVLAKQAEDVAAPEPGFEKTVKTTMMRAVAEMQSYGLSAAQLQFHRIDQVHDLGYDGTGVVVGIMDGGFNVNHEVFTHLRSDGRILAERDFVDGGNDTKANVKLPNYQSHGTSVAAIIAGKKDGTLMGVAPGVSLVLARTEDDKQEAPIEEDNWVAAIEWMQTLGVQVVNSSLGYSIFDSQPTASYTYDDMDGRTSAIARAATKAASVFNMVVVVSAGNEGRPSNPWRYITTPADADSILAVGSLNSIGIRAESSSIGPTSDGRTKPDVSARGECVFTARSVDNLGNVIDSGTTSCISGTSFASPHVAGMMALALQARPGMPAIWYVRKAQMASSLYPNPNNLIGYGKIDAVDLIAGVTTSIFDDSPSTLPEAAFVTKNFPNPFNPTTNITYQIPDGWRLNAVTVVDAIGRQVAVIHPVGTGSVGTLQWDGNNSSGSRVASGIYFAAFQFTNGASIRLQMHPMSLIK